MDNVSNNVSNKHYIANNRVQEFSDHVACIKYVIRIIFVYMI